MGDHNTYHLQFLANPLRNEILHTLHGLTERWKLRNTFLIIFFYHFPFSDQHKSTTTFFNKNVEEK